MRLDEVWLPIKPNYLQSLIGLIADLNMKLSPNGDMKNETNPIQLLRLIDLNLCENWMVDDWMEYEWQKPFYWRW